MNILEYAVKLNQKITVTFYKNKWTASLLRAGIYSTGTYRAINFEGQTCQDALNNLTFNVKNKEIIFEHGTPFERVVTIPDLELLK